MKQIILGTAGHIDHGKTSLIKALTGVNTDRLKEEQLRGITIELGFASLDLPSGQHLGIVDVPGHEKFVKNMVAGATGIDIVAMVIAADEGIMPQTREHLEICSLLGVKHGLIVLTKTDLVDEEWLELVQEDIREYVQGTFLDGAPLIPVSAVKEQGLSEFVTALDELSGRVPEKPLSNLFRLPVDRVFTMKGFGTVITGTLISGKVSVGDPVMIFPSGIKSKVRGVQVHNQTVGEAVAGMRTAINFQGLERETINRGDVVSSTDALVPSYMVDVAFEFLSSNGKALKNRTQIRFHTGTSEVLGNLILLDRDEIAPGDKTVAQIRLESSIAVIRGDRFVVRSYSPIRTIGGGQVLNPIPAKHKRFRKEVIQGIEALTDADPEALVRYHATAAGIKGVSFSQLRLMTSLPDKTLEATLQALLSKKELIQVDKENRILVHRETVEALKHEGGKFLKSFHKAYPLKSGMSKEELKSKFSSEMSVKLFNLVLTQMIEDETIQTEADSVRLAAHRVSLAADQAELKEKMLSVYRQGGLTPPTIKDLAGIIGQPPDGTKDMLKLLVDEGQLVKVKEDLYYSAESIEDLKIKITEFLKAEGELTPPQFKQLTGASRKYTIPLLEYFDGINLTIRIGDSRKLRRQS